MLTHHPNPCFINRPAGERFESHSPKRDAGRIPTLKRDAGSKDVYRILITVPDNTFFIAINSKKVHLAVKLHVACNSYLLRTDTHSFEYDIIIYKLRHEIHRHAKKESQHSSRRNIRS
jgi:hypothetical protein